MKRAITSAVIGYLVASYIAGPAWYALSLWSRRWGHWPVTIVFSPWHVPQDLVSTPILLRGGGVEWAALVMWAVFLLPMVLTIAIVYRVMRPSRPAETCLSCGYSLRGNASGICPECGTKMPG